MIMPVVGSAMIVLLLRLARLSARGDTEADEVLKRCMTSPRADIRMTAANAYVSYRRTKQRLAEAKAVLPAGDHQRMNVTERDPSEPQLPAYE